ncbi:gamma-tubulin complex component 5 isoform X1 [Diprion similis]|uniref:gamma-tubulin complex component 5 isoform X1 n=2 Tax=Diprion similis TaxID=362088 RepID=UPI001EF94F52|nr:gamma-tubulin complex component 5 isoform X1 [Diprion similis]
MATKILIDIHNDIRLLITAITGFEAGEEGFRICEAFALSNVKHHRFLSVNSQATKRTIDEVVSKFSIHGKYEVANKFRELVDTFLSSFDFDHHPQYDLQWSLLSLLLDLSCETNKSELQCLETLRSSRGEYSFNVTVANENEPTEEIDWGQYLKEGQDDFFCDYQSDTDSEWSNNDDSEPSGMAEQSPPDNLVRDLVSMVPVKRTESTLDKLSESLADGVESRNWLKNNVQNKWWTWIEYNKYPVDSKFPDAGFCELWNEITSKGLQQTGTLSEYQACREVLWMLHCPVQMVLFLKNTSDSELFSIKQDVSIPSLSQDAFSSILDPLNNYFQMLCELEQFGENLYPKHKSPEVYQCPPLTYQAYHRAVMQHLNKMREGMIRIEKKFVKQDDCDTLLSMMNDLKPYLDGIKMLYEVHQSVTSEWEYHLNWKCASKLLSGLFFEIQNSSSREKANMCTSLYLQSLSVYLNIIDTWLSEGRFEDWREEFVIAKIPEDVTLEDEEQHDTFVVRPLDQICLNDPIMELLVHKVRDMGRSIELLVRLDRIPDMWRMVNDSSVSRISLYQEFLTEVISEFSKYNPTDLTDTVDVSMIRITEVPELEPISSLIEQNALQQISSSDDPFLLKAFENYVPFDLLRNNDAVDGKIRREHSTTNCNFNIFERLENISQSILPSRRVLKSVLSKILNTRYKGASKLVKDIMVAEYNLEKHLKLMRCIYMMETGHVMNRFYQQLFTEIETNATWNNPNALTNLLEEILSQEWPETSSRWSIVVGEVRTHQVLLAVNKIMLHYAISWPMCMVLTKEALVKYNEIFRFQLKLKWALWTLDHLRFSDLEGSKSAGMNDRVQHFQARRLESLRFWLIHAIGSIHAYLSGQVLQSLGSMLEKALSEADNLDTIIRVHNEYLMKVHEHCLQTPEFEDLTATISSLLEMCVHVRDRWKCGAENIIPAELDLMESSYIKYHTYLALALHNAVQHKDADYLTGLSSAFNYSIPCV